MKCNEHTDKESVLKVYEYDDLLQYVVTNHPEISLEDLLALLLDGSQWDVDKKREIVVIYENDNEQEILQRWYERMLQVSVLIHIAHERQSVVDRMAIVAPEIVRRAQAPELQHLLPGIAETTR
ncbi:MAG: hypothetical protein KBD00_01005 [Candidatus Peribacteraceae bacterium]|nr:hypothetical protein [Candidatus Peribacteraceae bacterium]